MNKLYVAGEWVGLTGKVHIQNLDLVGTGRDWSEPAKVLGISISEFISLLKTRFEAEFKVYKNAEGKLIFVDYYWRDLAKARVYKNYLNKVAREKNYKI